jgi:hypothetical protein
MPLSITEIRNWLTIGQIVGSLLLLSKLLVSKLSVKYRYFSYLIAAEVVRLIYMELLPRASNLYGYSYYATAPIIWVLLVLVVLEFFQLVLKDHVGIATAGKKAVSGALILSAIVAGVTLLFDLQRTSTEAALLYNLTLLERMVTTSLFVLLLCLILFASHFPIPVSRNLRVHASILSVYFGVRTAVFFIRLIFGLEVLPMVNVTLHMLSVCALIGWTVLLSPAGETTRARRPSSASEERLLAQLESINETLLRSARK